MRPKDRQLRKLSIGVRYVAPKSPLTARAIDRKPLCGPRISQSDQLSTGRHLRQTGCANTYALMTA